jgi:hypothetical protein
MLPCSIVLGKDPVSEHGLHGQTSMSEVEVNKDFVSRA